MCKANHRLDARALPTLALFPTVYTTLLLRENNAENRRPGEKHDFLAKARATLYLRAENRKAGSSPGFEISTKKNPQFTSALTLAMPCSTKPPPPAPEALVLSTFPTPWWAASLKIEARAGQRL
jgi:hypothetical protein